MLEFNALPLAGAYVITPPIFHDNRGHFTVPYQQSAFAQNGLVTDWVQDNQSYSQRGVLRGFHFQYPPHTETKLVRALQGRILDVIVDLRRDSPTFRQTHSVELNDENRQMVYIPRGFGHAFCVLSDFAVVTYKVDNAYAPDAGGGLIWNDPTLNVDWPVKMPVLSEKDRELPLFSQWESPF